MMDLIPFVIFGVIGLFVLVAIGWSYYAEKKRRETLSETATELGLSYSQDGNAPFLSHLKSFKLFNQGRDKRITNLIQGDSGEVKIAIFDYKYTSGSGKNATTYKMTIASLESADLNCPDFTMRPENFFDRFGSVLGLQNIDFESHPKFSNLFVLQSPNEESVREFFRPDLLAFFETRAGISVEARPGMMFFYRPRKRIKPVEIKELLADAYEVFGHMVDQ